MLKDLDQMPWSLKVAFFAMIGTIIICLLVILSNPLKIDQGLATLVGTIAGFGLVAWQARIAFGNYTRSQARQAELDREAREHKAELDHKAAVLDNIRATNVLRSAIRAEIAAVYHEVQEQKKLCDMFATMHDMMGSSHHKNTTKGIIFKSFNAPVFKANIKEIGLLGVSIAADVIKVLSRANGTEFKQPDVVLDHEHLATLYKGTSKHYAEWLDDLMHVALRIRAVEENAKDPGTLIETQVERRAKLAETQAKK